MDSSKRLNELLLKVVRDIADYQFGDGVGKVLFPDECRVEVSKRTRRPRRVYLKDKLLATIRPPDNFLALTIDGALKLMEALGKNAPKVVVKNDFADKITQGMSVMAHHVSRCEGVVKPGDEVLVVDEEGKLLAVGRAVASSKTIVDLERGVVVKIRKTRESRDQN